MSSNAAYHRVLRVSTAVVALLLVFQAGLIDDRTTSLYNLTTDYLVANIGMSASVAPNEYNTITAELTKQQQLLASREAAVEQREIAVELNEGGSVTSSDTTTTYLLAAILFVQLVLIILNYGLDFLRAREHAGQRPTPRTSG